MPASRAQIECRFGTLVSIRARFASGRPRRVAVLLALRFVAHCGSRRSHSIPQIFLPAKQNRNSLSPPLRCFHVRAYRFLREFSVPLPPCVPPTKPARRYDHGCATLDKDFAAAQPVNRRAFQLWLRQQAVPEKRNGAQVNRKMEGLPHAAFQPQPEYEVTTI